MGSEEETNLTRKRSLTSRKASRSQDRSIINVADARREIAAFALKLHGSSSSLCVTEKEPTVTGKSPNYKPNSDAQYCYSLSEAIPLPGPVWSTTAPSVLAEPPSAAPAMEDSGGFEWGENQAASYTWWLGFLKSLDGNVNITDKWNYPFAENVVMENSKVGGHDSTLADAIDHSCCPDDWLMIPTIEMDLGDVVLP